MSAWLKCRHPSAFAAALLNSQPMGFYQPAQLVRDAESTASSTSGTGGPCGTGSESSPGGAWGRLERQGQVVHVLVRVAQDMANAVGARPAAGKARDFY